MSLKNTLHTQHFNSIPKKCKACLKSFYTVEDSEIYYQCSIFGRFKKTCELEVPTRNLPKPEEILKGE